MLDINFIRENTDLVQKSAKERGYKINIKDVIALDDSRKSVLKEVESLRQQRNEIAAKMKGGKPDPKLIEEGKEVKTKLATLEEDLTKVESDYKAAMKTVQNYLFLQIFN